jgi:hypothetical protein
MKKTLKVISLAFSSLILLLVIISIMLFVFKPDVVYAMQSLIQLANTLYQVDDEILGSDGFGQYYSELYWKHNSELIRIYRTHLDRAEQSIGLVMLYIHHLEALLDGRGNEVRISQEQVNALEEHLSWLASVSNSELREDIQRELSRTPLQDFVGLTMDEALEYVENTWNRDFPSYSPTSPIIPTGTVIATP